MGDASPARGCAWHALRTRVQRWTVGAGHLLIDAMSLTYWVSQFVVVLFALLWIYLHRVDSYVPVRNAIIIANTIALVIYVAVPTAPPRLFHAWGFYDTVAAAVGAGVSLLLCATPPARQANASNLGPDRLSARAVIWRHRSPRAIS